MVSPVVTLADATAFLRRYVRWLAPSSHLHNLVALTEQGNLLLLVEGDVSWWWRFGDTKAPDTGKDDRTIFGIVRPCTGVDLAKLMAAGDDMRRVYNLLHQDSPPRVSDRWEVWPRLWLGRAPEPGEHIPGQLVRLARPFAPGVTCDAEVIDDPVEDSEDDAHVPAALAAIERQAAVCEALWHAGESVHVTCLAGMNRSGATVAATLVRLGLTATEAVERVRWKRGRFAISNVRFHRWLVEDFGPRVAAERAASSPPPDTLP